MNKMKISNSTAIDEIGFSTRTTNGLLRNGYKTVADILGLNNEEILRIHGLGVTSAHEILSFIENHSRSDEAENDTSNEQNIEQYECEFIRDINFSNRTKNALIKNGIIRVQELLDLSAIDLVEIPGIGVSVLQEIEAYKRQYQSEKDLTDSLDSKNAHIKIILSYYKQHDLNIEDVSGLSYRASNSLQHFGVTTLSELLMVSSERIFQLKNVGKKTRDEILNVKNYYINFFGELIDYQDKKADKESTKDIISVESNVLQILKENYQRPISAKELIDNTGASSEDITFILDFLTQKQVVKKNGNLYRIYLPSVEEVVDELQDDRKKYIITERLKGKTLEDVSDELNITRERVRQIQEKTIRELKQQVTNHFDQFYFEEDYYSYFFTTYFTTRDLWDEYLGAPTHFYNYLVMVYDKGKKTLDNALDDLNLSTSIRLHIQHYLDRNDLVIEGRRIPLKQISLEKYVLEKNANKVLSFDEFADKFNDFISSHTQLDYDLFAITEDRKRTRLARLIDSRMLLYRGSSKFRYYDIDSRDYTNLFEALALWKYTRVSVSCQKFVNDYPDLMKEYDIKNGNELQHLLRNICTQAEYPDIHFGRMPMIDFGNPDRDKQVLAVIEKIAPATPDEVATVFYEEYGIDPVTFKVNWLGSFDKYYHKGVYSIDFDDLPSDQFETLNNVLTKEFYFISDIVKQYKELFPDGRDELISSYNLKKMGFVIYSNYVIKNYPSAESYFANLLGRDYVTDIYSINKRYGSITQYYNTFQKLKKSYEIVEYQPYKIVHKSQLEDQGITRRKIKEYCDEIYELVMNKSFFTLEELENRGLNVRVENWQYDLYFYSSLLRNDTRFHNCSFFGQIVLSTTNSDVTRRSFLQYVVNDLLSVPTSDLMEYLKEMYGIIVDRDNLTQLYSDTEMYYDKIEKIVYSNYDLYVKHRSSVEMGGEI